MLCEALATASSGTGTIIEERVVTQSHRMTPQTCCCVIRAENDMRGGQCAPPVPVAACERASCVLRLCRSSHECSARNLDPERKRSLNGTMPQGAACGTAAPQHSLTGAVHARNVLPYRYHSDRCGTGGERPCASTLWQHQSALGELP